MARAAGYVKGSPIDSFNRNFYILAIATVKAAYVASYILKDKEIANIQGLSEFSKVEDSVLKKLSVNVDGEFLRSRFFVRAGTAPKDPFVVSSMSKAAKDMRFIQTKNIPSETPFDFEKKYKLVDLIDKAIKTLEDLGVAPSETLKSILGPNSVSKYSDLMQIEVGFEQINDYSDTVHYKLNIDFKISHRLYPKIISSDDVAQNTYLLSLWLHNNFQASANRGRIIVDPRRVVSNTQRLIADYGPPKARVNKDGYALFKSGIPIKIPSDQRNYIDKLIAAGNAAVDENGFFNPDIIAENTNLTNKVVYVDWYNDLMVYTSATGILQTLSLRGTSTLSPFDEWAFLRTPMIDPKLSFVNRIVTTLVSTGVSFDEFKAEYVRTGGNPEDITGTNFTTYANVFAALATLSGRDGAVNVTYAHMCGWDMERIAKDVESRSSYSQASTVFKLIKAAGAYFRAFAKKSEEDSTNMWNLPNFAQPSGMRALLEGVNYLIFTVSKKSAKDMDILATAYADETEKWKTEKITKIKIPNVKIGVGGMQGLLPHQARIASSQVKAPKYQILSISTGGGKCADKEHLVLTDKGLIKLGELNEMSGKPDLEGFSKLKNISVLTRQGLKSANRTYHTQGDTVKVSFSDGDFFEGLPEHRLIALTDSYETDFVRLDKLNGKYVPKQNGSGVFPSETVYFDFDTSAYSKQNKTHFEGKKLPKKMTSKFATLLGLFVAEGAMIKSNNVLSFSNADKDIIDLYKDTFDYLFRTDCSLISPSEDRTSYSVVCSNKIIREFFEYLVGGVKTSYTVEIPLRIRMSPKKVQVAFLKALYEGDGTIYEGDKGGWNIEYTSASFLLIRQVKAMLSNFGIFSTIRKREVSATNGTEDNSSISYTLEISKRTLVTFCNEIGFLSDKKNSKVIECINHYKSLSLLGQDTNLFVHGPDNVLPIGGLVRETLYSIESLIKDIKYVSGAATYSYTLQWLWRNIGFSPRDCYFDYLGEEVNRLTINKFFKMLKKAPDEVKEVLSSDKSLLSNLRKIKELSTLEWIKVSSVEDGEYKDVYDISVPGPHEYVVDSLMSHNTITSYIDSSTAILNDPKVRPLISTKGNLIHNTISEINAISGGQFNAIPFTPVVIRRLRSQSGIKTMKQLMAWVKGLPPNTLLVNSYSNFGSRSILFEEMPHDEAFADIDIGMSQYNKILRLCNINKITGDESHLIKNVTSKRSKGAYAAMAAADYRTLMSGTLIANTVKDLVGQVNAATPLVFGDNVEKFCDDYDIAFGGILTDESAEKIKRKLDSSVSWQQATPDEWGYMLPDTKDIISFAKMTSKQEKFYNDMLKAAMLEIEKSMKDKKGGDEDGEDGEDSDEESEDDENSDDAFVASASKHLMGVEDFLVAPDANEVYVAQKGADKPTGDDLISPKVFMADQIITKHLAATANDAKNNKVIVFGWSLNGIRHFQKHSKFGRDAIVYFAGDNEAIRQFKNDPSKRVMIAAETSIREGENLQMTSLILRLQSVWTPGDHTQARARMYRPDPRGVYNRESLVHQWILLQKNNGEPSLDGLKAARLSSKQVHNARVTYEGRPEWKRISKSFDDISTFKMNLDNLIMTRASDVAPYFDAWNTYNNWEMGLNQEQRYKKARELEAISGEDLIDDQSGKIRDINKFISLAMVEVESVTIPGSRKTYTPWVPRVLPADPDGKWGWNTVGNQPLKEGDVVYTEYGPGTVTWVKDKSARVDCYGGRFYTLSRQMMCFPNEKKKAELAAVIKDPVKWHEMSSDISILAPPSKKQLKNITPETVPDKPIRTGNYPATNGPKPEQPVAPVKPTKPVEPVDDRMELEIIPIIINGLPALFIDDNIPDLKKIDGWNKVDPYISIEFRTWTAIDKFLDQLNDKFYMPQDFLDKLDSEMEALRAGKAVVQMRKLATGQLRDFIRDQHKKLGFKTLNSGSKEPIIRPYFLTVDRKVRIAFDIDSHDPSVIRFVRGLKGDPRVAKIIEKKTPVWFNVFRDISEARRDISNLKGIAQFDQDIINQDLVEIGKELKELAAPRRQPNV